MVTGEAVPEASCNEASVAVPPARLFQLAWGITPTTSMGRRLPEAPAASPPIKFTATKGSEVGAGPAFTVTVAAALLAIAPPAWMTQRYCLPLSLTASTGV